MAYYLRKENKKKGTYLQMYESHWDKEKKQPRSKSVMAFGYVHELVSDEIPDPVAYYTDFVAEKNKERAAAFTEETRPRAFVAPVEYNLGQFLLYTLLEELNIREVIDILAAQMRFQFRIYDMIAQLIAQNPKRFLPFSLIFTTALQSRKIRFTMDYPLLVDLIKNILNFLTIAMSSIIREISAMFFSTVRITILKLTFPMKINRKGLPKKTDMTLLSDRHFSWMQIWCRLLCRCTLVMNLKSRISEKSSKK